MLNLITKPLLGNAGGGVRSQTGVWEREEKLGTVKYASHLTS